MAKMAEEGSQRCTKQGGTVEEVSEAEMISGWKYLGPETCVMDLACEDSRLRDASDLRASTCETHSLKAQDPNTVKDRNTLI